MVNERESGDASGESGVHTRPPGDHESSPGRDAEPESVPVVATAAATASVGHGLHWPQNHELAQISIPDLLMVVSRNALAVIPAERCVVFMYEKTTNLLSAQVSSTDGPLSENDEELSFPPVMGVVSACFLQRRCVRMQEPNLHKAFHRDYDVPKDVKMDSMILAPVTLHHRTVGVIQLLNRIDPDYHSATEASQSEDSHSKTTDTGEGVKLVSGDEEVEMKLLRTRAVQQRARIGFSAKDEQKMILFTSHVAQLLDNKLKLLAQVESMAKAREEKAKSAIELLNMMNQKLEYQVAAAPVPPPLRPKPPRYMPSLRPTTPSLEPEPAAVSDCAPKPEAVEEDPVLAAFVAETDMLKVMKGISRTQALFRGHHLRKVHHLSDALAQHRVRRQQIRSTLVLQRATRRFLARRWRKKRRNAIMVVIRAIRSYKLRAGVGNRIEARKQPKPRQLHITEVVPQKTEAPLGRNGGVGLHHKLVESDIHKFRERVASALKIQRFIRGYQARNRLKREHEAMALANASKGVHNAVKLQSVVRGRIARTKVKRILEEKRAMRAANVVCMRLAASNHNPSTAKHEGAVGSFGHHAPTTRDCLYPLAPVQPSGAPHLVAHRYTATKASVEEAFDELRQQQLRLGASSSPKDQPVRFQRRRRLVVSQSPRILDTEADTWLESRPLAPMPATVSVKSEASERLDPLDEMQLTKSELARLYPTVVFEVDAKKAKRCPAGVQHADDWLKQRRLHGDQEPQSDRDEGFAWHEGSSNLFRKQAFGVAAGLLSPPKVPSNQVSALPLLTRSSLRSLSPNKAPLQVCFLPAGSHRRTVTKRPSESMVSSPPPQSKASLPPASSQRRALTTR